jgi:hypothetical protein
MTIIFDLRIAYDDRNFNERSLIMIDNAKIDRISFPAIKRTGLVYLAIGAVSDGWWKPIRRIGFLMGPAGWRMQMLQRLLASDCSGRCAVL